MNLMNLLALELYLAGWVLSSLALALALPRVPGFFKWAEAMYTKKALASDTPSSDVDKARGKAEKAREDWRFWSRELERLQVSDSFHIQCLICGSIWPVALLAVVAFAVFALLGALFIFVSELLDLFRARSLWCDECNEPSPKGWPKRRMREKAALAGWVVDEPKGEDYCPKCVAKSHAKLL